MNRDDIDKLFGSYASTNGNLKYMGDTWCTQDVIDYLKATGDKANAAEVIDWLRKFAEEK